MDQTPLVSEQIKAGTRFLRAFQASIPIQSAFWLKELDEGGWNLYIASEQITDDNFDVVYGEVGRIARTLRDPWFDSLKVKVIGSDDPLAKAAVVAQQRYPIQAPAQLPLTAFGGLQIEGVYLYPSPIPVAVG